MRGVDSGKRRLLRIAARIAAGIGGLAFAGGAAVAVVRSRERAAYDMAAGATWQPVVLTTERAAILRELMRCATMAANSHDTQLWRFRASDDWIEVAPDFERRCPAVDPDDHHLFVSLGCATENIVQASAAFGLRARPTFAANSSVLRIDLEPAPTSALDGELPAASADRECRANGRPRLHRRTESLDSLWLRRCIGDPGRSFCWRFRKPCRSFHARPPPIQPRLHASGREQEVRATTARFGRHCRLRCRAERFCALDGSRTVLPALCPASDGARAAPCLPQPACGGAIRARRLRIACRGCGKPARPGRPVWIRSGAAAVVAPICRSGLSVQVLM